MFETLTSKDYDKLLEEVVTAQLHQELDDITVAQLETIPKGQALEEKAAYNRAHRKKFEAEEQAEYEAEIMKEYEEAHAEWVAEDKPVGRLRRARGRVIGIEKREK